MVIQMMIPKPNNQHSFHFESMNHSESTKEIKYSQLIQHNPILILLHRLRPRHNPMIILKKPRPKPPKHPHNPQLKLTMRIASRRIINHISHHLLARSNNPPTISIPTPKIPMHNNRLNSLPFTPDIIPQMLITQ
jgi:hypothetical protein